MSSICGNTKRGLAWPCDCHDECSLFKTPNSKISWLYNWSPTPNSNMNGLEFALMQWGTNGIDKLYEKVEAYHAKVVLGFNEPERPDQSNMSPESAAREWIRVFEPLRKSGVKCGSPAISAAPEGLVWLKDFLGRIRDGGSDVDFYCFHWYGAELGQFYDYIWSTYYQLPGEKKPLWITEFACTTFDPAKPLSKDHVENFVRESCKYLDGLEFVAKYAWFGAMRDAGTVGNVVCMIGGDGQVTDIGCAYRDT
ncbi:glycoside hydrolase family 128 protein [Piedraia hortae CBS 480.64]|uniref:Glycoside hydrolase family 128 protein n=1 Tax=Piedraia hortae CBS 480.64 TaxID=1314780 RepID=A0A6A7BTX9_9PEZI|nr:glycoside hydrolase family 128 protein [Piedraia hortae CBS 480.64]